MDIMNSNKTLATELHDIAYQAYAGTSFDPERRRDQILTELNTELQADLIELGETPGNYEEKYIAHARRWLSCKSRCMSVMITGASNFPVRRNEKANNAEERAYQDFMSWRDRYFKAVNRVHILSPEDDMDIAIKKADKLMINQEVMKSVNKIVRKEMSDSEKIQAIIELGISEDQAPGLLKPDCMGVIGFASYTLTNNNAKIKAAKNKVETMKRRIAVKAEFTEIKFDGGSINIESDRVVIRHDIKPDRAVIDKISSRGFHWSSRYSSWSRKHTARALIDAREVVGL